MTDATKKTSAALEKKVRRAVTDLLAKGERPTNAAVRAITGGSFRDIGPLVKCVVAEQKAAAEASRAVPDMPEDVVDLFASAWEAAWRCADEAAAAERRAHASQLAELEEQKAEVLKDIGLVEDERDSAAADAEAAEERACSAENRVAVLTQQLMEARVRIAGLEGRLVGREEISWRCNRDEDDEGTQPSPQDNDSQMSLFTHGMDGRIARGDAIIRSSEGQADPARDQDAA